MSFFQVLHQQHAYILHLKTKWLAFHFSQTASGFPVKSYKEIIPILSLSCILVHCVSLLRIWSRLHRSIYTHIPSGFCYSRSSWSSMENFTLSCVCSSQLDKYTILFIYLLTMFSPSRALVIRWLAFVHCIFHYKRNTYIHSPAPRDYLLLGFWGLRQR